MTPYGQPETPVKPAALPLVALILGVIGFCVIPLFPVAIVLAIVSLVKSGEPAYAARKTLSIITLVLGLVYVPVVGILAAIAIPNFVRFQARSKQSECKVNLKAAYRAEKVFYAAHDAYSTLPQELELTFDSTRYLYRFDRLGTLGEVGVRPTNPTAAPVSQLENGIPDEVLRSVGIVGKCPECEITIVCAGNVDNDSTIDVWSVSTVDRIMRGEQVPAGIPWNDVSDVTQ